MANRTAAAERWIFCTAYFGVVAALLLIHLVPLSISPGRIPGPDLMVAVTLAWVLRRPHYVPILLVGFLFLMADLLFMRPIGLWAALIVIAVETLRARVNTTREQTFPSEWLMVATILLTITVANRVVLTVFLIEQVSLGLVLFQYIATILAYPLVVFASRLIFGITKMTASEAEALGPPR